MAHLLIFQVHSPAQRVRAAGGGAFIELDPVPTYIGNWLPPDGSRPPVVGTVRILGGTKVGNRFVTCRYLPPGFAIPGMGEIEVIEIGDKAGFRHKDVKPATPK